MKPEPWQRKKFVKISNFHKENVVCRKAEVVSKGWSLMKGLMFREKLEYSQGLLMVFPLNDYHSIWMFGMKFPIDLVFISRNKVVVDVFEYFLPMGWNPKTWKVYTPKKRGKYVLEINAGEVEKRNIEIGDLMEFE